MIMKPEEQLELLYNAITQSRSEKDFFVSLGRYIKHIIDDPRLSKVAHEHFVQRQDDILREIHNLETPAREEIDASYEQLKNLIADRKITDPAITKAVENYQHILTGKVYSLSGQTVTQDLHEQVGAIIAELQDKGYSDIIAPFVDYDKRTGNIIHKFSPTFPAYDTAFETARKKQKIIDEWGDWFELQLAYDVMYRIDEILKDWETKGQWATYSNYQLLGMEMGRILKQEGTPDKRMHLKQDVYTGHINRFHVAMLIALSSHGVRSLADLAVDGTSFDDELSQLKIGAQTVPIPSDTDMRYLCKIMFQHKPNEPVDWSIIYEEMAGEVTDKVKNSRRVRDTMGRTNEKIKKHLNTEESFFEWGEKSVKRKY